MALNQLGLGFLFTARDEASRVINKIERSFGRLNDVQKDQLKTSLMQGAIGAGGMLAGWKGFKEVFGLAKEAGEFKQVLADVGVIAGATGDEMKQLHDASYVSDFAGPKESAQALLDLAQAGYDTQDSIKLLQPSLDMMAASLGDLSAAASANLTAQTLKAFGLEAAEADLVTDKLINTANDFALKARELPLLIGRASRGAISFGASLEETLVAVGLARNVMGGIEVAASGVSMAMERIVDPKHQKKLRAIGVAATDSTGHFKNFSNLLLEIQGSELFQKKTFAQQEAFILSVFGHRSLAVVQAFYKQVNTGVKANTGEILKGAAAVDYLMGNVKGAKGAKARFIEAHFGDNLPGQMSLLRTSLKKLGTSLGETFEPIFAHVVARVRKAVDQIFSAWNRLSPETKAAIGKAALVVLGLVTAFGALVTVKAGVMVLTAVLAALGTTLSGLLIPLWPVAAALLVVAAASYAVYKAYQSNLGGFADFVHATWQKVKLAVQGLAQLFSKGEFSGAVMTEIDKIENSGVKSFVITLWGWAMRVKNFFVNLGEGFKSVWPELQVVFGEFFSALRELGSLFGVTIGSAEDNAATFRSFGEAGKVVGKILGGLLVDGVKWATAAVGLLTSVVQAGQSAWAIFGGTLKGIIATLSDDMRMLFGALSGDGSMFTKGFVQRSLDSVKVLVSAIFSLIRPVAYLYDLYAKFQGLNSTMGSDVNYLEKQVTNALDDAGRKLIKDPLAPAATVVAGTGASAGLGEKLSAINSPMPSPEQARADGMASLKKAMEQLTAATQGRPSGGGQPGVAQINVSIGGEQIMSTLARLARADASQGYSTPAAEAAE
jgi:TP901 family phage tail tape measure protein